MGYRNIAADAKQLGRRTDTQKLAQDQATIGNQHEMTAK